MHRRKILVVLAVVGLTVLAGCSSVASGPNYSVSDANFVVEDGQPKLVFDYNASDYATVLVEAPNGEIVKEKKLNPNETAGRVSVQQFQSGQYRLVVREGGDTVAETGVNVSGASIETESVTTDWSENTFERASIVVNNTGDVPVRIDDVTAQVAGETITSYVGEWVAPERSTTVAVAAPSNYVKVESSGMLYGKVEVETSEGEVSDGFSKQFDPPKLSISSVNAGWEGAELEYVAVEVENTGDVPAQTQARVERSENVLAESGSEAVQPGESEVLNVTEYTIYGYRVFTAEEVGTSEVEVSLRPSEGAESQTISKSIEPANFSVDGVNPIWDGENLDAVEYNVTNKGDLEGGFRAVLTVNGKVIDDFWMTGHTGFLEPEQTHSYEISKVSSVLYTGDPESTEVEVTVVKQEDK